MKRRRRIVWMTLACGLVTLAAILALRDREPRYEGRSLSEWIDLAGGVDPTIPEPAVADAIRHIGTNALPWLVRWLRYEEPAWKRKGREMTGNWPRPLRLGFLWESAVSDEVSHAKAVVGFKILGPAAGPAVPELAGLIRSENSSVAMGAMYSLGSIGQESLPPLLALLADPEAPYRLAAASTIDQIQGLGTKVLSEKSEERRQKN
jgi:hypothetical protein